MKCHLCNYLVCSHLQRNPNYLGKGEMVAVGDARYNEILKAHGLRFRETWWREIFLSVIQIGKSLLKNYKAN
jgi:hypothetical protein